MLVVRTVQDPQSSHGVRMDDIKISCLLYLHKAFGAALERSHSHLAVPLLLKKRKFLWPEMVSEIDPTLRFATRMILLLSGTLPKFGILGSWKRTVIQLLEKVAEFVMQLLGELTAQGRGVGKQTLRHHPAWTRGSGSWLQMVAHGKNPGGQNLGIWVAVETVSKCSKHQVQA